jgi:predicted TPR repeat methyltransferase
MLTLDEKPPTLGSTMSQPMTDAPAAGPVVPVPLDLDNALVLATRLDGMGRGAEASNIRASVAAGGVVTIGMPLERVVESAIQMHRGGAMENAEIYYRAALAAAPDHARANHFYGVALHRMQRSDEGLEHIRRSLDAIGDQPWAWNNYGNVLKESGRSAEAARAYEKAIGLDSGFADAHNNMGIVSLALNDDEAADRHFARALELDPDLAAAHANRGQIQLRRKQHDRAMQSLNMAVVLTPEIGEESPDMYGRALLELGDIDKARVVYENWLKSEPGNPVALHMLKVCGAGAASDRASDDYVAAYFDDFASKFDAQLAGLDYRAPELCVAALREMGKATAVFATICDAGCGTGLCGPLLRPMAARLVGVDLSSGMLNEARARAVYDELAEAELTAFLLGRPDAFDAIVSADTLCYFGALEGFAAAARDALRPQGSLVFTVEASSADDSRPHVLLHHGRYAHRRDYVEGALREAGFLVEAVRADALRNQGGRPVQGWVVSARRL